MENTTITAEGSAPAPAPAQVAEVTPARPDIKTVLAAMSSDERRMVAMGRYDLLKASPSNPVATPEASAAPAASAPAVAVPSIEQQPTSPAPSAAESNIEDSSPDPGDASGSKSKRFRFTDEKDQAIVLIAKTRNISLLEASRLFEGTAGSQAAPAAQAAPAPAVQAVDTVAQSYDAKIAEAGEKIKALTDQRAEAADELDNKKMLSLSDELADLKGDLRILNTERQTHIKSQEKGTQDAYQGQVNAARDRVLLEFPAFADDSSMERMALDSYVTRALKDPSRKAEFADPSWPEKIGREFAIAKGIAPKGSPSVVPATAAPRAVFAKPQPQQVTSPAGAKLLTGADGQRQPSASKPLTKDDAMALIRSNPEARRAIVKQISQLSSGGRR